MSDWNENEQGNHVYVIDTDQVMTVFRRADGDWAGVYHDEFTKGSFGSAEEAMRAMEPILDGDTSMLRRRVSGWVDEKKRTHGRAVTANPQPRLQRVASARYSDKSK